MRQSTSLHSLAIGMMVTFMTLLGTVTTNAQGIRVHTKDGQTVNYPAETFSHVSPYIGSSYGIDVYKTDGSCDNYLENNLDSITTYEADMKAVISRTGGIVTMGDLTIDMPAGTFSEDADVLLSEAPKGFVDGEGELSKYYKVKLTSGVRKGFKVFVKMPKLSDEKQVRMQFATMGWATSIAQEFMVRHYMDVTYENGAYVAEIPEMENPDSVSTIDVWFGITTCDPGPESSEARRRASGDYLVGRDDYSLYKYLLAFSSKEFENLYYDLKYSWIPEAMAKLEQLGYNKGEGSRIEYYLVNLGEGGTGGFYTRSPWGKKYSEVYLNYTALAKLYKTGDIGSKNEIRSTVIHETFHYYQWFYDSRKAALGQSEATILEEASSVWSEHVYTGTPAVAKENANMFLPCINPVHKDILLPSQGIQLSWGDRFQNMGYGLSTLLEYLTQKCGTKILTEIWEDRQVGDPYDYRNRIEAFAKRYGVNIFTQEAYQEFVEMLGCGKIYEDLGFDHLVNFREEYDSIGVLTRQIKNTHPVYFTNYLFEYGALVEKLEISGKYDNDNFHGLDNATGLIEQTTEGVTTKVYRFDGRKYLPCGTIRKGEPLKISPEWFYKRKIGDEIPAYTGSSYRIFMATIPDDFTTTAKPVSRIVAQVFTLDLPEKKLSLPASEGTKKIKMKSNYADLLIKSTDNWLVSYWSMADSTLFIHYDALPGNDERTATIQVFVLNEEGKEYVLEEIEVNQHKAFIDLTETEVEVPVEGGNYTVTISATNCTDLKVSTESNFLHPTINGSTITVKVDENVAAQSRQGWVDVNGVMKEFNIPVKRSIQFNQAGTVSPKPVDLYNNGAITVDGQRISIPGKTYTYGDYLLYRSSDTEITRTSTSRKEFSWNVELYIDPKDNLSMRHYQFYSGSVTWLQNYYYTETTNDGNTIEHLNTIRCSYNLKNLHTRDGLSFESWKWNEDNENNMLSDYVSEYSYEMTVDGKTVTSVDQSEMNKKASTFDVWVDLRLGEGVPYLEADRDSIIHDGSDGFEILRYTQNDEVQNVQVTTSDSWLTIENFSAESHSFYLYNTVNNTKAPREGYVYITGTLADGKKLTRTIVVQQSYEAIWEDDWEETEDQKAELPSEAVLDALRNGGMPLHLGTTPPKLNGIYKMEPLRTVYELNNEGDSDTGGIDYLVLSMTSNSSNAGQGLLSYYSHMTNGKNSPAEKYYCYVGGDGKDFTLSNVTTVNYEDLFSFTVVTIVSGTLNGNQVENLYLATVTFDDGEIEDISIGTDSDGISPTTTWEPGDDDSEYWARRLRSAAVKKEMNKIKAKQ